MEIDINKLIDLCKKHTVKVSLNGLPLPFTQLVIEADNLFEELHKVSELSKDDFVEAVNRGKAHTHIKDLFDNLRTQGVFRIAGFEALGDHYYIECKKLKWLN